jgi:DNA-binding transcriptional ArsR family regulator
MSGSTRRLTLLVVLGLLVSSQGAVAAVAAQSPTTSLDQEGKRAAVLATSTADDETSTRSTELDGALAAAPFGTELAETMTVGSERISHLTQVVAETPLGVVTPELLLAAGYNRRSESSALESDTRRALYEHVRESPGSYLSELSTRLDVSVSTVRYHARVLENHRVVVAAERGGKHRLYPVGGTDPTLRAALDEEATARILRGVERLGPVTVADLASELDLAASTVSYHLTRLDDDGLVTRERDGRMVYTELTPAVDAVVGERGDGDALPL